MSNIRGPTESLEIGEIRTIVLDALRYSMMRGSTIYMEQLPKMILEAGHTQGKLPRSDSDVQKTPTKGELSM